MDLQKVVAEAKAHFQAARALEANRPFGDTSAHWDFFRPDFEVLFDHPATWDAFRGNGFTLGLDDNLGLRNPAAPIEAPHAAVKPTNAPGAWPFERTMVEAAVAERLEKMLSHIPASAIGVLSESGIGGPPSVMVGEPPTPVDWHDLGCVWYVASLLLRIDPHPPACGPSPKTVLEIGGGYGATAAKLRRAWPDVRLILVDLPESGSLQWRYLSEALPGAKMVGAADVESAPDWFEQGFDVAILPPSALETVPDGSVDLALNLRSFMEMRAATVAAYIAAFERVVGTGGLIYVVNRFEKDTSGDMVRIAEYPFDDRWRPYVVAASPLQPSMCEVYAERAADPLTEGGLRQALSSQTGR